MKPRLTELRQEILGTVQQADRPINARMILRRMPSNPDVSTVYRALDYLEKEDLVHSVSFSRTTFYYAESDRGCGHFLYCGNCHEILQFEECFADDLQQALQERFQYRISKHVLSFEGVCSDCQASLDKKANAAL